MPHVTNAMLATKKKPPIPILHLNIVGYALLSAL